MKADMIWHLQIAMEGLLTASAYMEMADFDDCDELGPHEDGELIEAISVDLKRCYSALERLLTKYDSVPDHCKTG